MINYSGGVEPDGIERVEVERGVRAVENRPSPQLRRREPRYDDPRELRCVEVPLPASRGRRIILSNNHAADEEHRHEKQREAPRPKPLGSRHLRDEREREGQVQRSLGLPCWEKKEWSVVAATARSDWERGRNRERDRRRDGEISSDGRRCVRGQLFPASAFQIFQRLGRCR